MTARPVRLDRARELWLQLREALRAAPATAATKLVDEIREDLDETFPGKGLR